MSVFVRQEKITVGMGLQSDPIDLTKTRLYCLLVISNRLVDESWNFTICLK